MGWWRMATLVAVLWVITLTVWANVIAGVLKGPTGVLAGAVLTALAAVVASYVPLIRPAIQRRPTELARLEAVEEADQEALRRVSELLGESPAGLLDPRRGLVRFTGRDRELAELLAWCQDDSPNGVRLVTGPGGVGKTRLSVELCARLHSDRWRCVRVGDRKEAAALELARRGWPYGVLLVVDYAETRIGLPDLLRAVAADPGPGRVRVLLLAAAPVSGGTSWPPENRRCGSCWPGRAGISRWRRRCPGKNRTRTWWRTRCRCSRPSWACRRPSRRTWIRG